MLKWQKLKLAYHQLSLEQSGGGRLLARAVRFYQDHLTQYTTECPNGDGRNCSAYGYDIARLFPATEAVSLIRSRISACGALAIAEGVVNGGVCDADNWANADCMEC